MEEMKQVLEKVKKKKWGKEEWIILILVGIFLLIVFWPTSPKQEESVTKKDNTVVQSEYLIGSEETYKEQMEKQLEEVLKSIDGIDNVRAMITLKTSEEEVVLKETNRINETTEEEDSQGGLRIIKSESIEEAVCYGKIDDEISEPYVTYTVAPKVEGVLVVIGGDKASLLRTQIVKAVQALFGVESHKVVVIKMKES